LSVGRSYLVENLHGAIAYQDQAALQYVFIQSDGTNKRNLAPAGHNFAGLAFNRVGNSLVYNDSGGRGGKRITPGNPQAFEIMPYTMDLAITDQLCMSETGTLMFIYRWSSSPLKQGIYIGHFTTTAVSDKPGMMRPQLSPNRLSRTPPPGAEVALTFIVGDPDGLEDVVETCADEFVNGAYVGEGANSPASFYDDPHDDGLDVDWRAGDGRFTTSGVPGGKVNDYDVVDIRIGTRDASGTIVLWDIELPIVP
jgi:hypothetical protein